MINYASLADSAVDTDFTPYHHGGDPRPRKHADNKARYKAARQERITNTRFIAWDGEGLNQRGAGKPQDYVLFGCSVYPDNPLMISGASERLAFLQIAEYICDVGSRHPGAKHIGYGFNYDINMITGTLSPRRQIALYRGRRIWMRHNGRKYSVEYIPGKFIVFNRYRESGEHDAYVRIDDCVSFFQSSFIKAYQSLSLAENDPDWHIVIEGKAARGEGTYEDLPTILRYWQAEIVRVERLIARLNELFVGADIYLNNWHGPGAIANYVRKEYGLKRHEWGGKEPNLDSNCHDYIRHAYYGGRFEQGIMGRVSQAAYGLDIRSAYPHGFTFVPTLASGGEWHRIENPTELKQFAVYRIHYEDSRYVSKRNTPQPCNELQPFPHRDSEGSISYPPIVDGHYWGPEVIAAKEIYPERITVFEGWEWWPDNQQDNGYPWRTVIEDLYRRRQEFKRAGNPSQYAIKIALNSLYGKQAQRVGWKTETMSPPDSHTLCIAGFVTSFCRAMIYRVVAQIPVGSLIAIETDGIYTSTDPATLNLPTGEGEWLGQWEIEHYDEIMYVQSGVYAAKLEGDWVKLRTRGFNAADIDGDMLGLYLQTLTPEGKWEPLSLDQRESHFVTIGDAINRSRNSKGAISDKRLWMVHCVWEEKTREIDPAGKGKRAHMKAYCDACAAGLSAYDAPHVLTYRNPRFSAAVLRSIKSKGIIPLPEWQPSSPHFLPWESNNRKPPKWMARQKESNERVRRVTTV